MCAGAVLHPVDIPVGTSYGDNGFRVDCHDVVGCTLSVPMTSGPSQAAASHASTGAAASSRGASQPAETMLFSVLASLFLFSFANESPSNEHASSIRTTQ